jgi:DNA-binding NarL/FixJ family response regulator
MTPQAPGAGPPARPAAPRPTRHRGGPPRVLLVDAARERREGLRLLLEESRMTVFDTASGTEALALAGIVRPDAVLIDLRLPDWDGLALAGQLRHRLPEIGVVVQTTADRATLLPKAQLAGALDVVDGGTDPAAMLEAMREAVSISRTAAQVAACIRRPA